LEDVAKSVLARWPKQFSTPEAFRNLGYRWMTNRAILQNLTGERIIHVNYRHWMQDPNVIANLIEKTFFVRVDRDEIHRKINVHDRPTGYLPPAELPDGAAGWLQEGTQVAAKDQT
jgi:hypothetical protein